MILAFLSALLVLMPEVLPCGGHRMTVIGSGAGDRDLLVATQKAAGCLLVTRWSPGSDVTRWTCAMESGLEPESPAICTAPDVDGDSFEDWVLVHQNGHSAQSTRGSTLILGSGRSGQVLRQRHLEFASSPLSITRVVRAAEGYDVLIGTPSLDFERGGLVWVRSVDLASVQEVAPTGLEGYGWYVGPRSDGMRGACVSAPWSDAPQSLWVVEGPSKPPECQLLQAVPEGHQPLCLGLWVTSDDGLEDGAQIALGAVQPFPNRTGAVQFGDVDEWSEATTVIGPPAVFGTHFGSVVAFADDLDGDGRPELLVTDPGFREEAGPLGACYVIDSRTNRIRQLCQGTSSFARLGTAMRMVDDVDGDGFRDVALFAPGRVPLDDAYVSVRSLRDGRELRRLEL